MKTLKRIEIISSATGAKKILEVYEKMKIPGYTFIPDVYGKGDRGYHLGDDLSDASVNGMIIILCEPEAVDAVCQKAEPLIEEFGGICTIGTVELFAHS